MSNMAVCREGRWRLWAQVKPADVSNWSLAQRSGSVLRNGTKLLGVGFFASLFGVTITNVLVKVTHYLINMRCCMDREKACMQSCTPGSSRSAMGGPSARLWMLGAEPCESRKQTPVFEHFALLRRRA